MDRLTFLTGGKALRQPNQSKSVSRTLSGLAPYAGPWGDAQVAHLLKRTMFGSTKDDIAYFKSKTMSQAVNELLTPAPVPSPPLKVWDNDLIQYPVSPDNSITKGTTWVNAPLDGNYNFQRLMSVKGWWLGLMLNQNRSIHEKMTLFWHNHFATETETVYDARYVYKHLALLRQYALGNFKQFVKEITIDPAMLRYLNGSYNTKTAPDENYARELQELFCCGKGNGSQYTEDDVKAAAKVLTGFRDNSTSISYTFDSTRHDTSNKQFSAFYNNTVITGQSGAAGANELDQLLNMIFGVDEVALFICRKLYINFIYYEIDAAAEANVIQPLANIFRTNNYNILPVLDALFKSEHFYDAANMGCNIKSPMDFIVGYLRELQVALPPSSNYVVQYQHWQYFQALGALYQQNLLDPPNVAGWPAYYQDPLFYEMWINSDTYPNRVKFTDAFTLLGYNRGGFVSKPDLLAFVDSFSNPEDPNKLLSDVLTSFYRISITTTTFDFIKNSTLLTGQTNDNYWTNAWTLYKADPTNAVNKNIVLTRLQNMFIYIMRLAEYQLS